MKIITRQTQANDLVARFEDWEKATRKYCDHLRSRGLGRPVEELRKLGPNPDPDKCDAVIRQQLDQHMWPSGNVPTWTQPPACKECGAQNDAVVQLGEEPDYEPATAWVCLACLRAALALAEAKPHEKETMAIGHIGSGLCRLMPSLASCVSYGILREYYGQALVDFGFTDSDPRRFQVFSADDFEDNPEKWKVYDLYVPYRNLERHT
jgi:hypothetical protein